MTREITARQAEIEVGESGRMTVYLARPDDSAARPVVLVGSELWGLTGEVRAMVREVAELGYVAIAPDIYHRSGTEGATGMEENDANRQRGFAMIERLRREEVEADLRAALSYARDEAHGGEKAGALGFSLGGHVAFFGTSRLGLDAAAIYYPGWLTLDGIALSRPEPLLDVTAREIADGGGRVLLFWAELDHVIDAEQRRRVEEGLDAAGARFESVVYPGAKHAFFFPGREMYDKSAAEDSWTRVRELFAAELG
ncbi:dienelactone hydrolase family protein [Actinomadura logoneensis]|uniref:Dienelactone hydrolase family protein n=1 Tax=Actinomadura logoneensis TaxID=2293572 RepID=A0A372JHI0_9ACTN|nr:dienelactone hydrolase family protein [Actinomadura logoneensis]RFU39457.1 dienelactone hydrolase family protein [Actinomadura logoneensis]